MNYISIFINMTFAAAILALPVFAQDRLFAVSGQGRGGGASAALAAKIDQLNSMEVKTVACGDSGRLYGPGHPASDGDCVDSVQIENQNLKVSGDITTESRKVYLGDQRVSGDDNSALFYDSNHDTASQIILRDRQGTQYGRLSGGGDGQNVGLKDGDGDFVLHSRLNSYLRLMVDGNERMRILSNGNVGIGTSNPAERLHVAGNGRIDGHIRSGARTIRDGGGGWVRTYENTGWYNGTHGGGWYMTDSDWIRAYNDKNVTTGGQVRAQTLHSTEGGNNAIYAAGNGNMKNLFIRDAGKWVTDMGGGISECKDVQTCTTGTPECSSGWIRTSNSTGNMGTCGVSNGMNKFIRYIRCCR